jgi:hypothetical protein
LQIGGTAIAWRRFRGEKKEAPRNARRFGAKAVPADFAFSAAAQS